MKDIRIAKLADVLVNYSVSVKSGDFVFIRGNPLAEPLIDEVLAHILRAGGNPITQLSTDGLRETFYLEASEEQLKWVSPVDKMLISQADVYINIGAPANTRSLTGIDPEKQRIDQVAHTEIMEIFMKRSADGELRWVSTDYPCQALAQDADMSLRDYEDFVYRATFADQPDPIKCWREIHDKQERLVKWLKGKKQVVVRSLNVNLTLSIEGRNFINADGINNMPCGEIFTGPVENSANGWVHFTYPAIESGREVEGVKMEFKDGKVVKASAQKNEAFLLSQLESDEGARYLGEFAIGTNYGIQKFTKNILFDEKIGGTFHLAIGAGYPETGSVNKSAIHWDFICDMRQDSEILVDGKLFYKNGDFQI